MFMSLYLRTSVKSVRTRLHGGEGEAGAKCLIRWNEMEKEIAHLKYLIKIGILNLNWWIQLFLCFWMDINKGLIVFKGACRIEFSIR